MVAHLRSGKGIEQHETVRLTKDGRRVDVLANEMIDRRSARRKMQIGEARNLAAKPFLGKRVAR